jgi:8-oxo-dGTP pyrophosphatase MutT (NUDIX family)
MGTNHASFVEATATPTETTARVREGAKAVIRSSASRVLLVWEAHDTGGAFWTLHGGGRRADETLLECLKRELREELRCESVVSESVGNVWYSHQTPLRGASRYTVFSCRIVPPVDPVRREGILETKWVLPAQLPAATVPQVRHLLQMG